jgi:hypothetical protein
MEVVVDKDDIYFIISSILAILGLLGLDWKLVTGRVAMRQQSPSRKRQWFLLLAILGSIAMSGIGLYQVHSKKPDSLLLNISAYDPPHAGPMNVISDQKFEDQDIPLDGFVYKNCSFKNVCFEYDGTSYILQNSTVQGSWKVCVKDSKLKNYLALMDATYGLSTKGRVTNKTIVVPR